MIPQTDGIGTSVTVRPTNQYTAEMSQHRGVAYLPPELRSPGAMDDQFDRPGRSLYLTGHDGNGLGLQARATIRRPGEASVLEKWTKGAVIVPSSEQVAEVTRLALSERLHGHGQYKRQLGTMLLLLSKLGIREVHIIVSKFGSSLRALGFEALRAGVESFDLPESLWPDVNIHLATEIDYERVLKEVSGSQVLRGENALA